MIIENLNNCTKKYSIVYTDPSWQQSRGGKKSTRPNSSGLPLTYKTMPLTDIEELHRIFLRQCTEEKHNVFMWAIDKYLPEAETMMKRLGYKLHARIVWDKLNGPQGSGINKDVSFTLNTADRHAVAYKWCVRRLTPKECERLQGYPDDWTVLKPIDHMTDEEYAFYKSVYLTDKQIKGVTVKNPPTKEQLIKWHNKLDVDGARYKQLGNSLAIPCALRVIGYIADHVRSTTVPDGDS